MTMILGADDFAELPAEAVVLAIPSNEGGAAAGVPVAGQTGGIGDPDRSGDVEARPAGRFTLTDDFLVLAAAGSHR